MSSLPCFAFSGTRSTGLPQLPPNKRRKTASSYDRLMPRLTPITNENLPPSNLKIPTLYQQSLSLTMTGSSQPNKERTISFFSDKPPARFSSLIAVKKVEISKGRAKDAPDISNNPNDQVAAYCKTSNCIGLILDQDIYLIQGDLIQPFTCPETPRSIAFVPQGNALLLHLQNGKLFHYQLIGSPIQANKTWDIDLSHDDRSRPILASERFAWIGEGKGRIRRIDCRDPNQPAFHHQIPSSEEIERLAAHPKLEQFLAGGNEGTISLFSAEIKDPLDSIQELTTPVRSFAFSPSGRHFLACSDHKMILVAIERNRLKLIGEIALESPPTTVFWQDAMAISTHSDGKIRTYLIDTDSKEPILPSSMAEDNLSNEPITHAFLMEKKEISTLGTICAKNETLTFFDIKPFGKEQSPLPALPQKRSLQFYSEIR